MENRIKVFSEFATSLSRLSKCEERKVAAIITDAALMQVYSIGINGGPKGLANCLCVEPGKYGCVHAEINALIKCTNTDTDKVMFLTLAPCEQCAAAMINSGFSKVYYTEDWKDNPGVQLLRKADICVIKVLYDTTIVYSYSEGSTETVKNRIKIKPTNM